MAKATDLRSAAAFYDLALRESWQVPEMCTWNLGADATTC